MKKANFFVISKSAMASHNAIRGDKTLRIPISILSLMDYVVIYDEHSFIVKKDTLGKSFVEEEIPIEMLPTWIKDRVDASNN